MLDQLGISRAQLVDLAILVGTDFNTGVKGIGPRKALELVQTHGAIELMPESIRTALDAPVAEIRRIYLEPAVTSDYSIEQRPPDHDGILRFLCDEREFSRERISAALERAFGKS